MSVEQLEALTRKKRRRSTRAAGSPFQFGYQLLTRHDLAARLHVTPITVTRLYAKWGLRPIRIGGKILFPSDQVEALERRLIENGETA